MTVTQNIKLRLKARYVDGFKMAKRPSGHGMALTNEDLDPVPVRNRNWNWKTYASYWLSESWGATAMSVGATMVAGGLLWWQAVVGCAIAHVIGGILTVLNCVSPSFLRLEYPDNANDYMPSIAIRLHVPCPVPCRHSRDVWHLRCILARLLSVDP